MKDKNMKDKDITVEDWLSYLAINPDEKPICSVDLANFRMEIMDSSTEALRSALSSPAGSKHLMSFRKSNSQ